MNKKPKVAFICVHNSCRSQIAEALLFSFLKGSETMAATRLIPLHVNKGKTVAQCLADRTDYSENAEKTNDGEFISSYECDAKTADEEFLLTKRQYQHITGRQQKDDIIAYQLRQSFKPGEITPEEANQVGYELAMRFTKGKHAFIVATHIDRAHIHNHIIYNSTALDCTRKFKNFFLSSFAIQKLSDRICAEHGLSIITPKPYRERTKRTTYPKKPSQRDELCTIIDQILREKPKDFNIFIQLMADKGYEFKDGKQVAFCKKGKRAIRLRSLGKGDAPDIAMMNANVRKLLEGAIQSDGIEELFETGKHISEDIFSDEYINKINAIQLPNTKIKILQRLLSQAIDEFKKVNKIMGVEFADRLKQVVEQYNNRRRDEAYANEVLDDVAEQLTSLLEALKAEKNSFKAMGIDYEEKAFYDILKAVAKKYEFDYPEDKMIELSRKVKVIVDDKAKYTDWSSREDIKANLQVDLIILLDEYGYSPVTLDDVYKEVLEQAENFKKYSE